MLTLASIQPQPCFLLTPKLRLNLTPKLRLNLICMQSGTGARAVRKRKTAAWSDDGSAADSSGEQGDDGEDGPPPSAPSGASVAVAGANLPSILVRHRMTH